MLNENSVSRGYGFSLNYGSGGREAQWAIRRADGPQRIYYRISVYEDAGTNQSDTTPPFPADTRDQRNRSGRPLMSLWRT